MKEIFFKDFQPLIQFFQAIPWLKIWQMIKYGFIFLDILLVFIFIFLIFKVQKYLPKEVKLPKKKTKKIESVHQKLVKEKWHQILEKLETKTFESMKLAIIEAENLVSDLLKELGYEGEHFPDLLAKLNPQDFPSLERLLLAHRFKNEIIEKSASEFSYEEAKENIKIYQDFLKDLGVL